MTRGLPWIATPVLMIAVAFLIKDFGYYSDQYRKLMLWVVMATALGSAVDYFWRVGRAMNRVASAADDFAAAKAKRERSKTA